MLVLLVGRLVLLVDDDDAQVHRRGEQRAPRADHHVGQAVPDVPPLVEPLPLGQAMVQHCNPAGESGLDDANRLRRQRDLRNQIDRLLALLYRMGDGAQVHLGLAASGDTVQQKRARQYAGVVQRGANAGHRPGLRFGELIRQRVLRRNAPGNVRILTPPFLRHQPALKQGVRGGAESTEIPGGVIAGPRLAHGRQELHLSRSPRRRSGHDVVFSIRGVAGDKQSPVAVRSRSRQANLLAHQAASNQALKLTAGDVGAVRVHLLQERDLIPRPGRFCQFQPCRPCCLAEGRQVAGIIEARHCGQPRLLLPTESGRQHRRHCLKGGATIGLSQPLGQLQPQRADQGRRLHGMQDVPCLLFGHRRLVRQAQDHTLDDAAPELHPDQLPGLHSQVPRDAIREGLPRLDPVSVYGDVGVVQDATSRITPRVEISMNRRLLQSKTAATAPGKGAGGG